LKDSGFVFPATRQFWQPRFYDFNVYSHKKKKEKLEYMRAKTWKNEKRSQPQDPGSNSEPGAPSVLS
jgi:hypothetical protein